MAGAGSIPRANWRRRSTARASALSSLSAAPCRWSSPGLAERIEACLAETKPSMVIALGLWPGEPTVRLERLAVNLADCTTPDNAGALPRGELLDPNGAPTLSATPPLRAIERRGQRIPCGFIHLPYLPQQVAEMLSGARTGRVDLPHGGDFASMDVATMERALRISLAVTASEQHRLKSP